MIEAFLDDLLRHDRFVLSTHIRPDGDALGSELAMARFLRQLGKEAVVINSDAPPYNLMWMPGAAAAEVFDGSVRQRELFDQADCVLVMDTNTLDRLGKVGSAVEASRAEKILIDHHPDPEPWFDAVYARTDVSSTGQLVYELIAAHDPACIDEDIATTLYAAIMTDTGSFRFSNVNAAVHRAIADLLERGRIEATPIHEAVYDTRSLEGLRLMGLALETVTLRYDGAVGYIVVSQRMVRESRASLEETEGFVNYVLSVEGVRAALIFTEIDAGIKISFRSKGDNPVNGWARSFGGGGHPNASGAFVKRPLDEVVDSVIRAAPKYLDLDGATTADTLTDADASYLDALVKQRSTSGR